jgi:predicted nucleic acid-binding protein
MREYLLDTNVIKELVRLRPEPKVISWFQKTDENLFHLSVLTLGEIRKGVSIIPDAKRRVNIEAWLEKDLHNRFEGRILPISEAIADRWGALAGHALMKKKLLPVIDGLLAATAIHHNLTFVTRNTNDVAQTGVAVFNTW